MYCPAPWDMFGNRLVRFVCHAHLSSSINDAISLPFRSVWNYFFLKMVDRYCFCIIISSHFFELYDSKLIETVKKLGGYVVFEFSDRYAYFKNHYKHFPSVEELKKNYDLVITYNVHDSQEFGFELSLPRMPDFSDVPFDEAIPETDVLFVGNNKGRIKDLIKIYEKCTSYGLKCDFHINGVEENEQLYSDKITYNTIIQYSEVLKRVRRTKCVLNLVQEKGQGVTLRDYEALGMNKFLLTNNTALKDIDFIGSEQIIWIDDLDRLAGDIVNRKPIVAHGSKYTASNWFSWLKMKLLDSNNK